MTSSTDPTYPQAAIWDAHEQRYRCRMHPWFSGEQPPRGPCGACAQVYRWRQEVLQ